MKRLLSLLLFAGLIQQGISQVKFQPGYIIMITGEKVNCFVKNKDWKHTPESIEYKMPESSAVLTAVAKNTKEVHVGVYTFKTYTVDIDRSPEKIANLTTNSEPVISRETVFLRVLVEGEIDLLSYTDNEYARYFYLSHNTDSEPQALIYKVYRGDDNKILYNKTYKSTLQKLFKDRISNYDLFKTLEYNDQDLKKLFRMYNRVTDAPVEETSIETTSKIHLKAGTSARYTSLTAGYSATGGPDVAFDKKMLAAFGAEVEWLLPNNRNKWAVFLSPYYFSYSNNAEKTVGSGASEVKHILKAKYTAIDLQLGARYYMYLSDKSRFFVNGGYVFSKSFGNSRLNYTRTLAGSTTLTAKSIANQQSSIFGGAGYAYKNISAEIRYHNNRAIHGSYAHWNSKYSDVGLVLQYSIL